MADDRRIALLIGVGENPGAQHLLPSLAATVDADLRALGASLEGSGYEVETLANPTRNEITEHISDVSASAPPGSTLLLYFTGHGVRIGTTDYLVPADALAPAGDDADGWERPHVRESLLEADISRYLADCRAGTVLWLIDACRAADAQRGGAFGSNIVKGPPHSGFAMMTSCGPGELSGGAETGSFFTSALARAFDPLTEATTVEQVYERARRDTRTLAVEAQAGPQQVLIRYGDDLAERTRSLVVAEGRRLLEAWQDAVRTPALWERVPECEAGAVAHFQDCLSSLAAQAALHVHHAQRRLPDPWADDEYPVRLLGDRLPLLLPKGAELSALEVTALIAGVLLHETAWAERLGQAAGCRPRLVWRDDEADDQRRHYEQITEHYPQITEKLTHAYRWLGDPADDRHAVTLWLVHRWIEERFATDEEAVPAVFADRFTARLLDMAPPAAGERLGGRAEALSQALRTVAAGLVLGAPPEDQRLPPDRHVVRRTPWRLRVRPLAALLRLAGLLAFDTRCLPEVLAEHLAVSDPVVPREVITVLRDAYWVSDGDGNAASYLHLDAVCPHPALHAALATVVEDADDLGHLLRESARRLPQDEAALLRGLPARLSDHGLRPDRRHGTDAYDVPLARFSLAQTEIRRLLMGEKLYDGEPELALRELYQNAMDACRYREMRVRYLRDLGREPAPWAGHIRIETGEDDRGRYVECVDNGVGMTVDQLKSTFTRAGRRFDQSHAFRREQAAWLRHDSSLRLHPNSRFGIGVFSYFMLADEMTIVTRPVGTDGRPAAKALRVEIPVSGSLFRVREEDEHGGTALPEGGTRVRLHLRRAGALPGDSAVSVLRSLVLLSEFLLEVRDQDGTEEIWRPGRLKSGEEPGAFTTRFAVEAVPGTLWWVSGKGAIVCDGIATDERPFGYVLNLSGAHAGELSVNRKKLERYDVLWAQEQVRDGARAFLDEAVAVPELEWLWNMESREPSIARILWKVLRGHGVLVSDKHGRRIGLDEVGWFRLDAHLNDGRGLREEEELKRVRPWRLAALGAVHRARSEAAPLSLSGHPVPQPGWAEIAGEVEGDWRNAVQVANRQATTVAEVLRATRGLRVAHPDLAGPAVFGDGDLEWEPGRTDWYVMTGLLGRKRDPLDGLTPPWGRRAPKRRAGDEIQYRHPPEDLSGIARASAMFQVPLGELAEACARYAPFLRRPLGAVPDHHRDHVCTEDELQLLYLQEDKHHWRPAVHPWDVPVVAAATGLDPGEVQRRMAGYGWLGRPVPDPFLTSHWGAVPAELLGILRTYLVPRAGGRPVLPWAATVELAAEDELSVWEAERLLARETEDLGVDHRRRYTRRSPGRDVVPSPETARLAHRLHQSGIRLEDGVTLRDLASVRSHATSWEEMSWYADELREAGVDVPDAGNLLRAWDELPTPSRYAFSGEDPNWDGADYPVPATSAVLFTGSQRLRQRLSVLWDTAHREARNLGLDAGLVAPRPPKALRTFVPTHDEMAALVETGPHEDVDYEWFETPRWTPLTAQRLVGYARARSLGARAAYRALAPLRAIGALVPELSTEAEAALPDDVPTAHDAVAVDPAYRVSAPGAPLHPLDLVGIAGRLGEPVRHTWERRITPYLALEASPPSVTAVPDVVPGWQDLAILSEGLDGRLPALTGPVGQDRIEQGARAVGETPEWVHRRLELYAGLFGLRLP
ncbi:MULTISPECIES: caspase family protein [Streptomyces]|uniref:High temperature protein G n=1 Tax=Streptomyces chartreusis NRRL 3882 TaxID=1079985 RepID=A0A2N9BAK2_STRCX|nr:caspase family protein [Streptomyces chartreusis]MYS91276.1 peptidase C14 [Streptomyces sp. SID5464]SOR80375.1 High temperature protein G [Streptomyces chartreusis NRRL 3882]